MLACFRIVATEIPFVWGNFQGPDLYWDNHISFPFTAEEQSLTDKMRSLWGSFAASGRPTAPGTTWPEYTAADAKLLQFEVDKQGGSAVVPGFKHDDCAFWASQGNHLDPPGATSPVRTKRH
jgi:carboxylesterase type B